MTNASSTIASVACHEANGMPCRQGGRSHFQVVINGGVTARCLIRRLNNHHDGENLHREASSSDDRRWLPPFLHRSIGRLWMARVSDIYIGGMAAARRLHNHLLPLLLPLSASCFLASSYQVSSCLLYPCLAMASEEVVSPWYESIESSFTHEVRSSIRLNYEIPSDYRIRILDSTQRLHLPPSDRLTFFQG